MSSFCCHIFLSVTYMCFGKSTETNHFPETRFRPCSGNERKKLKACFGTLCEAGSVAGSISDKVHVEPDHDAQGCSDADKRGQLQVGFAFFQTANIVTVTPYALCLFLLKNAECFATVAQHFEIVL